MLRGSKFSEPLRQQLRRWGGAAVLVTGMHVGAAGLALTEWPEEEVEELQGAVMFELSPLPIAAVQDVPDSTVGPPVDEITPPVPEKRKAEAVPDTEIPLVDPSPLAPDPDVALPTPQPDKQPEEKKDPDPEPTPEKAEEPPKEAVVPQMSAPPPMNAAPPAPSTAARAQGSTAKEASNEISWKKQLMAHLGRHRRFPSEARARNQQGDALVEFVVDRRGQVIASSLAGSSGSSLLDEEALAVLQRAVPLPEPPGDMSGDTFRLSIPIRFRIK